jgi:TRAP-type C4-dicarboxylate transport system permease large subunit
MPLLGVVIVLVVLIIFVPDIVLLLPRLTFG